MTEDELQRLSDLAVLATKFSGSDSHSTVLAALIKGKAIEEAGRAVAESLDHIARETKKISQEIHSRPYRG